MLERTAIDGAYTLLSNYPDQGFSRLLESLAKQRGASVRDTP
jgi:hypothetical protein